MSDQDTNSQLLDLWTEVKVMVTTLEQDVAKNAGGNSAAGVRARKGFRLLKKKLTDLTKCSLEAAKKKD